MFAMIMIFGVINVYRYSVMMLEASDNVKLMHVIALSAGGMMRGAR